MFDIRKIPKNQSDFALLSNDFRIFYNKMEELYDTNCTNNTYIKPYAYRAFFKVLSYLYCINRDPIKNPVGFIYWENNFSTQVKHATDDYAGLQFKTNGIVINQEASTHWNTDSFPDIERMTAVEEHIKQSSQHFLRIFTKTDRGQLFVYTNKELEPKTMYHLLALEAKMHNEENLIYRDFIQAFIDDDPKKATKVLEDFLNSDEIKEQRYKKFEKVLVTNNQQRIDRCKRSINERRNSITTSERQIASWATEIRELTEQMHFYMTQTNDEDNRLFYKYLLKHPYIKDFTILGSQQLLLDIESPIVYFSEVPIEKYLKQDFRSEEEKTLLKVFLSDRYQLWTKTAIIFDTKTFATGTGSLNNNTHNLLPQPHIMEFGCFGNHRNAIADSAETNDYIGAVEQISQATMNINFYDACVIDRMLEHLLDNPTYYITWLDKETGELLDTATVIERSTSNEETQSN